MMYRLFILYFGILFILCSIGRQPVYANDAAGDEMMQVFPYPGILPGHLFYPLKDIRDSILAKFISSRSKKLEYDVFASNKLFREMWMLYKNGRHADAYHTGLKAENFLTWYVADYKWMMSDGLAVPTHIEMYMEKSVSIQQKVLEQILSNMENTEDKGTYEKILSFLIRNSDGLKELKKTMGKEIQP